jgi:hypothetical protein
MKLLKEKASSGGNFASSWSLWLTNGHCHGSLLVLGLGRGILLTTTRPFVLPVEVGLVRELPVCDMVGFTELRERYEPARDDDGRGMRFEPPRVTLEGRYGYECALDGEGPLYVRTMTGCEYVLLCAPVDLVYRWRLTGDG